MPKSLFLKSSARDIICFQSDPPNSRVIPVVNQLLFQKIPDRLVFDQNQTPNILSVAMAEFNAEECFRDFDTKVLDRICARVYTYVHCWAVAGMSRGLG